MTQYELELYKKCVKKKSKYRTHEQFESAHEYSNNTNDNDYDY